MRWQKHPFCILSIALMLCGCAYQPTKGQVDATHAALSSTLAAKESSIVQIDSERKLVTRVKGTWLGVKVKPLAQEASLPAIFKQPATLAFPGRVNLRTIAERVTKVTGITVTLKPDVFLPLASFVGGGASGAALPAPTAGAGAAQTGEPQQAGLSPSSVVPSNVADEMELHFIETPLREILNQIGSRFGINWTYKESDGIVFSRLATRTFTIMATPGDTSLSASLGKAAGSSSTGGASVSFSSNGQVGMNANFSIWTGIQNVLDTIKSPFGRYYINQATGNVTVTDIKEVLDIVQKYIETENAVMTKQVAIRVEVLSVSSTDNNEAAVNWNAVFTRLSNLAPQWSVNVISPSTVTTTTAGTFGFSILAPTDAANRSLAQLSGSQALINALQGYGRITSQQTFSAVTLNRQPVPLAVTSQLNYLQRTTPGANAGTGGAALPGLEPGLLTTGFLSNILPTILDNNKILLQFSIDSSVLKSMGVISTGQGATLQSIQTPQVDAVQTVQRVALMSGSTLVLTGFQRDNSRYEQRGLTDHVALGGSYTGERTKDSIVIVLTPVIVDGA